MIARAPRGRLDGTGSSEGGQASGVVVWYRHRHLNPASCPCQVATRQCRTHESTADHSHRGAARAMRRRSPPRRARPPSRQALDQDKPAPIRVAVDVVAVDVQVIDRAGRPVPDLGPEKFSVTINGRRRRVVSAERIGSDAPDGRTVDHLQRRLLTTARPRDHARGRLHQFRRDRVAWRHPVRPPIRPATVPG